MTWQPAPIDYPDIETVAPAKLRALLTARSVTDVYVGRNVPSPRRDRMVTMVRDGGAVSGGLDHPRLRVLVWDLTDKDANDLAALVVALMPLVVDGDPIVNATHLSGPYEIPDDSGQPCRYLLFEIYARGEAL